MTSQNHIPQHLHQKLHYFNRYQHNNINNIITNDSITDQTDELLEIHDDNSSQRVPASVSNTLAYHQLPGAKQSQVIISLSPQISQLLDANIPQQLNILCNTPNLQNAQLTELHNMLITLFASYLHLTHLGIYSSTSEEKEDQNTEPFFDNLYKHLQEIIDS